MPDDPVPAPPLSPATPPRRSSPFLPIYAGIGTVSLITFGLLLRSFLLHDWSVILIACAGVFALLLLLATPITLLEFFSAQARRGLRCLECGYPLRDIPGDAPCPECGTSRWSAYTVEEALDNDAIQDLLARRDRALATLAQRLSGRCITRVAYAESPDSPLLLDALPDLHLAGHGVELGLDDGSVIHAKWSSPPCFYLALDEGQLDSPKRDMTSHGAWTPYLGIPLAHIRVQRHPMPMDLLQPVAAIVEVPTDVFLTFRDSRLLVVAARAYPEDVSGAADPGSDSTLVVFGTERATLLGLKPVG